jgi:hypothetical protein
MTHVPFLSYIVNIFSNYNGLMNMHRLYCLLLRTTMAIKGCHANDDNGDGEAVACFYGTCLLQFSRKPFAVSYVRGDFRFSRRWVWRRQPSGTQRCVVSLKQTDVTEVRTASIIWAMACPGLLQQDYSAIYLISLSSSLFCVFSYFNGTYICCPFVLAWL